MFILGGIIMIRHLVFFSMKPQALGQDGLYNAHTMAEHFRRIKPAKKSSPN